MFIRHVWKQLGNTIKVEKDYYECPAVIIHAVLSAWHYKNTKCLGMSAVPDQLLMFSAVSNTVKTRF